MFHIELWSIVGEYCDLADFCNLRLTSRIIKQTLLHSKIWWNVWSYNYYYYKCCIANPQSIVQDDTGVVIYNVPDLYCSKYTFTRRGQMGATDIIVYPNNDCNTWHVYWWPQGVTNVQIHDFNIHLHCDITATSIVLYRCSLRTNAYNITTGELILDKCRIADRLKLNKVGHYRNDTGNLDSNTNLLR